MSNSTKFVFVTCYLIVFSLQGITGRHPDFYLSIEKLVNKYGYPMENHEVTTEDGYILTMFRIPHGRTGTEINQKLVILVHGLYGQAEHFITNAMHNGSLAFLLADNGYDVWLMNSRGTQHGRKHIRLDPNESKFWNFSWHEIAMYDLPAKIDYMLQKTKKSKLHYIGHSQGGTIFYVLSAMKPEYQKKIQLASLLSPAGYGGHIQFPLFQYFGRHFDEIMRMVEKYNIYEFPNLGNSPSELLLNTCIDSVFSSFCLLVMRNFNGIVTPNVDLEMLPLILRFIPTAAMKQSLHYLQGVISGRFRQWDYGNSQKNIEAYGTPEPPEYNVESISVPVSIYYGLSDLQVTEKDLKLMCQSLQNCVSLHPMKDSKWSHYDYLLSNVAGEQFNVPLLRSMQKYDDD